MSPSGLYTHRNIHTYKQWRNGLQRTRKTEIIPRSWCRKEWCANPWAEMGIQEEIRLTVQWWSKILPNPGFGSKYNQKEIGQKMKQTYIFFFISPFNSSLLRHNLNAAWFTPLECATKWLLTGWGLRSWKVWSFSYLYKKTPCTCWLPLSFSP